MKSNLTFRPLIEEDYKVVCEWWEWWRWRPVAKESLPDNGTGGFMIQNGNINVCAGFLYTTNSNVCKIEWIISNYKVKDKQIRKEALEMLITTLVGKAKSLGFRIAFTYLLNENLKEKFGACGFTKSSTPIEMIKVI